jgi:hypothetical protein
MSEGIHRLIEVMGSDTFQFVVNGENTTVSLFEAIILSPKTSMELQHDMTTRQYIIEHDRIESRDFCFLLSLFKSNRFALIFHHYHH